MAEQIEVSQEFIAATIAEHITPGFEAKLANGRYGRAEGSLLVLGGYDSLVEELANNPSLARDPEFYEQFVLHEHSWGNNEIGALQVREDSFTAKAFQKALGCIRDGNTYATAPSSTPDLAANGFMTVPGASQQNIAQTLQLKDPDAETQLVTASYSGLWWWDDHAIAEGTLTALAAELAHSS